MTNLLNIYHEHTNLEQDLLNLREFIKFAFWLLNISLINPLYDNFINSWRYSENKAVKFKLIALYFTDDLINFNEPNGKRLAFQMFIGLSHRLRTSKQTEQNI